MNKLKFQLKSEDWDFGEIIKVILLNLPVVFAFLLPISQKLSTLCLPIWFIFSIFTFRSKKLNMNKGHLIPILYYIILMLSFLYSNKVLPRYFEYKMSLIAIPVLFILNKEAIFKVRKKILTFFVLGSFLAVLICFINALYNSIGYNTSGLYFSSKILEEFSLANSILYGGNHFFATHFSVLHQTVYFSMYLTFAILIVVEYPFKKPIVNWSFISVFIIAIICILNRASYLIFFLLTLFLVFKKIKSSYIKIFTILVLIICGLGVYNLNPRMKRSILNVKTFLNNKEQDESKRNELINNIDRRFLLWDEAIEVSKKNYFFGLGLGDVEEELNARFKKKSLNHLIGLNVHNQYLQALIEFGLIGLILLLLMFYYTYKYAPRVYTNTLGISFIILIGVNFLFESMFSRYSGLSFIVFFYCLFTNFKKEGISR